MFKPNNKKMLTVLITLAMVFSALAVLSFAAQPAYAASGSITLDPTVFAASTTTITLANGGTFGAGATVTFYESSTTAFTSSSTSIGTFTLPGGTTTLSNAAVKLTIPVSAGTYYVAASDDGGKTFTSPVAITVSTATPSITISPSSAQAGSTVTLTGTGFDSGSTIAVYLNYASGPVLLSSVSEAALSAGVYLTVPTNEPGAKYTVVAQESSSSSPNYGITADASLTITPVVKVSPASISGAITSTFTITGYGFPANDSFAASTALNPSDTITVGGVDALNPAFTSSSSGSFTVTVTGLSTKISSYGSNSISVTDTTPTTFSGVGTILVSVPNPTLLGFTFDVTPTYGSTYNVNDSVAISVYDFPVSQNVQFYLGRIFVGSLTTDSNGAGALTTVVPPLPGGSYTSIAVDSAMGLVVTGASYTITASFQAVDPSGVPLSTVGSTTGEYVPSNGNITVQAYGLDPTYNGYDFYDSIVAPSSGLMGVYASGLVTSISVGTGTSNLMQPAPNGTLIFTYSPGYASLTTPPATGTPGYITSANGVAAYGSATASYQYYAIGAVTFTSPSDLEVYAASSTGNTLSVSGLIPSTAALYPGITSNYNAYIGNTELTLTFTTPAGSRITGTAFNTADTSIVFPAIATSGVYNFSITYNGQPVSSAVGVQPIVVSSPGSSGSAGTLVLVPTSTATTSGWDVVGFGYDPSLSSFTLYWMTDSGKKSAPETLSSEGTFVDTTNLASISTPPAEAAGTYAVFTSGVLSGTTYFVYSSYTITASLALSANSGDVGTSIGVTTSGLVPTSFYNLYFGTMLLESGTPSSLTSFTVPLVPAGSYNVTITLVGSAAVIASAAFQVKTNPDLMLSTDAQYAFPGQIVQFSAVGLTSQELVGQFGTTPLAIPVIGYEANVYLNGTLFATVPATFQTSASGVTYLNGSFKMPNNAAGSYYLLKITGITEYETEFGGSLLSTTQTAVSTLPMIGSQSDFLGLAQGNGALLTGITPSQIATIEFDINSTVTKSLSVPIAQLNAAITSINGAVANLKTTVGNMTVALSTINATVLSISKGVALLQTDLGQVQTSLASLNASLVSLSGNVATIKTTVGMVNTSVNSINMTVSSTATSVSGLVGSVATIQTSLGTISGTVTSISGSVATIQTSIGTLQTSVNSISLNTSKVSSLSSALSTSEVFEIVILVLVLITLVLSFLAISSVNRVAKKVEEQKKQ